MAKKVRVTFEWRLTVPDHVDADEFVLEYLVARGDEPAARLLRGLQVVDVEEVEPWDTEPWDAVSWGDDDAGSSPP